METPDKAADLADPIIADAINRDWLEASARSSRLSTDLHQYQLDLSSTSNGTSRGVYGATHDTVGPSASAPLPPGERCNERSWLLRHYTRANNTVAGGCCTFNYTVNGHFYDNISFADSPILARSLSLNEKSARKKQQQRRHQLSWSNSDKSTGERDQDDESPPGGALRCYDRYRIFLACYVLLGITLAIYSRNALSLAAVGMIANNVANTELIDIFSVNSTSTDALGSLDGSCPVAGKFKAANEAIAHRTVFTDETNRTRIEAMVRESIKRRVDTGELVDWTPGEQGLIFAAGSLGNLLIAIPITRLGEVYGPKWIIFAALFGATLQAALMPIVSPCHVSLVIIFQIVFNGLTYGADCVAYTLFAFWLTPIEMAFFVGCLLVCYQLGTILSSAVTARILSQGSSWSWCFYTPAILCGLWTFSWVFLGASQPSKSWIVSKRESNYLQRNSKIAEGNPFDGGDSTRSNVSQPGGHRAISWLKLAKDSNIWAIIGVKFTLRWYFSVYVSLMPTYLSSVVHMSVETIGKMNVFQSIVGLVSGILMGYLTKSVVSSRPFNVSLATFRKTFQSIVNFGLASTLAVFIIYDCNQWVTIVTLTLSGICINFYVAAALQLPLDLSPDHCGLITSITNTLALGQALGAPISGLILNNGPKDRALWRIVWGLSIFLNTLSGLLFIFLVDSKPKDYNKYGAFEESLASHNSINNDDNKETLKRHRR